MKKRLYELRFNLLAGLFLVLSIALLVGDGLSIYRGHGNWASVIFDVVLILLFLQWLSSLMTKRGTSKKHEDDQDDQGGQDDQ